MNRPAHIDVRGPYPVYVRGLVVIPLPGAPRDITVLEVELNLRPDGQSWHGWFVEGVKS